MSIKAAPSPRPRRTDVAALPFRWRKGGRSREGELYRRVVRQLRQHLRRRPSVTEDMIIARIAWLQVHLSRIDERSLAEGGLSEHARREYLAWTGAICRLLRELGLRAAPEPAASLPEILGKMHAAAHTEPVAEPDDST